MIAPLLMLAPSLKESDRILPLISGAMRTISCGARFPVTLIEREKSVSFTMIYVTELGPFAPFPGPAPGIAVFSGLIK